MAKAVLLRQEMTGQVQYLPKPFVDPLAYGFGNISALMSRGYFNVVESPEPVPWNRLPVNTVQIRGQNTVNCYRGVCYQGLPKDNR